METRDYYQLLRIQQTASYSEIRTAYRAAAKACHPDTHPNDPAAKETFERVNHANEILTDPNKRQHYDKLLDKLAALDGQKNRFHTAASATTTPATPKTVANSASPPRQPSAQDLEKIQVIITKQNEQLCDISAQLHTKIAATTAQNHMATDQARVLQDTAPLAAFFAVAHQAAAIDSGGWSLADNPTRDIKQAATRYHQAMQGKKISENIGVKGLLTPEQIIIVTILDRGGVPEINDNLRAAAKPVEVELSLMKIKNRHAAAANTVTETHCNLESMNLTSQTSVPLAQDILATMQANLRQSPEALTTTSVAVMTKSLASIKEKVIEMAIEKHGLTVKAQPVTPSSSQNSPSNSHQPPRP